MLGLLTLVTLYGVGWTSAAELPVRHADPSEVADKLRELYQPPSPLGVIAVYGVPERGTVVVVGTPEGVASVRRLLAPVPSPQAPSPSAQVELVPVKWGNQRSLASTLSGALDHIASLRGAGVRGDRDTNSVIFVGTKRQRRTLRLLLQRMDRRPFSPRPTSLPRALADAVASVAGGAGEGLFCHVVEGTACVRVPLALLDSYDGMHDPAVESGLLASELADLLVFVLDHKHVEHGRRNGVKLRCIRASDRAPTTCALDWGWGRGWEPVRLR